MKRIKKITSDSVWDDFAKITCWLRNINVTGFLRTLVSF